MLINVPDPGEGLHALAEGVLAYYGKWSDTSNDPFYTYRDRYKRVFPVCPSVRLRAGLDEIIEK